MNKIQLRLSSIASLVLLASHVLASVGCSSFSGVPAQTLFMQAEDELRPWREKWATSGKAAEGEEKKSAERALDKFEYLHNNFHEQIDQEKLSFRTAEAYFANGDWSDAYSQFRLHLESYPLTENRPAIEKWIFQIAVWWQRDTSFAFKNIFVSNNSRALEALNYIVDNAPRSSYADQSLRLIGEIQMRNRDFLEAIATYERILQGYPDSRWCDLAQYSIAIAYLAKVHTPRADRDSLIQAESRLKEYLKRKEAASRGLAEEAYKEACEKLAESEFEIGEFYRIIEKPYGARMHYQQIIKRYPQSPFAAKASERLEKLPPEKPVIPEPTTPEKKPVEKSTS